MKTRVILLFLFAVASLSFTKHVKKTYPFEKWRSSQLDSANTAKNIKSLSDDEKNVIFFTNLVRVNPKLFGETYAQKYIDSTKDHSSFAQSLLTELKTKKALPPLQVDSVLCVTSADHATKTGKAGTVNHDGQEERYDKVKKRFGSWGENCDFGKGNAFCIVMRLLIDQDNADFGHRENILADDFTHIGTAIRPHKIYGLVCVQDFGG